MTTQHHSLLNGFTGNIASVRNYPNPDQTQNAPTDTWFHYDHLGTVKTQSALDGTWTGSYLLDTWGNFVDSPDTGQLAELTDSPSGASFTTKSHDTDTGIYYFWRRWYDTSLGRFTSQAPFPPDVEHPYSYAENRPSIMIDPNGKIVIPAVSAMVIMNMLRCLSNNADSLNRITNSDKFKHCVLNCRFVKECCPWFLLDGTCKTIMRSIGDLREIWQSLPDNGISWADIAANSAGLACSGKKGSCEKCCGGCKYKFKNKHRKQ